MNSLITIITPSFNRAYTLPNCYESLKKQTNTNFVWMVVDDGSLDNTKELVESWISECQTFPIIYIGKENGGKASALNVAFANLKTEYAVVLDSDDLFFSSAIESAINDLKYCTSNDCCGLMYLRHYSNGSIMGGRPLTLGRHITMVHFLNEGFKGELICFYKSEILTNYRFPQIEGEKFVSPQWLDFELSRKYFFVAGCSKICICEYIADGLTRNKKKIIVLNPKGYTLRKKQSLEFSRKFMLIVKNAIMYDCGAIIAHDSKWLSESPRPFWTFIMYPIGFLIYLIRFRKLRKVNVKQ